MTLVDDASMPYYVVFGSLCLLCAVLTVRSRSGEALVTTAEFKSFQRNYLLVYLIMFMSDWLQGPYVYALYQHYGFTKAEIAQLFIVGFGSSMVFGTFVGSLADRFGRKLNCLAFGILYACSCVTKHFNDYNMLLLGRLLGGVSTSILFSAFEAWMIHEHKRRAFPDEWLAQTFQYMTLGNSIVAIVAGVIASAAASTFGFVAPFDIALVLLLLGSVIVLFTWRENYGEEKRVGSADGVSGVISNLRNGARVVTTNGRVFLLGTIQSLFESAMYIFVFMWTPTMEAASPNPIPHGVVFACFMVSIMVGSYAFNHMMSQPHSLVEDFSRYLFLAAGLALAVPTLTTDPWACFFAFNLFEGMCGIYFPSVGTMRGKFIPEEVRATVMNFFRIGLNFIVVMVLLNIDRISMDSIFLLCSTLLFTAFLCQQQLFGLVQSNASPEERTAHGLADGEEVDDALKTKVDPSQ